MKKVVSKEAVSKNVSKEAVKEDVQQPATNITYSIEHMNQVLSFLSQQKYSEVAGLVDLLKTKGQLS